MRRLLVPAGIVGGTILVALIVGLLPLPDPIRMEVGKRLAVGEVTIYSDGSSEAVAHVTSTYSIPETR